MAREMSPDLIAMINDPTKFPRIRANHARAMRDPNIWKDLGLPELESSSSVVVNQGRAAHGLKRPFVAEETDVHISQAKAR